MKPYTPSHTHHSVAQHGNNSAEQHTPPHFPVHNKHATAQTEEGTGTTQEGSEDNAKGEIQSEHGAAHTAHHPRHSTGPPHKRKGDTNTQTGRSATLPPFTRHATHHPLCHPTIHNGLTPHHCEGGSTQRIPHHTNSTDIHSPPTHHSPGKKRCMT